MPYRRHYNKMYYNTLVAYLFLILNLLFAVLMFYLMLAFLTGAPFVPSNYPARHAMLRLAKIRPGMTVIDLGSGSGTLLFLAASAGATAIGYEINPFLVLWTRIRARFHPYGRLVRVYWRDFWKVDTSPADVIFVYLLPWRMARLQQKLDRELHGSAIIISNSFVFPDWKQVNSDEPAHVYAFSKHRKT